MEKNEIANLVHFGTGERREVHEDEIKVVDPVRSIHTAAEGHHDGGVHRVVTNKSRHLQRTSHSDESAELQLYVQCEISENLQSYDIPLS